MEDYFRRLFFVPTFVLRNLSGEKDRSSCREVITTFKNKVKMNKITNFKHEMFGQIRTMTQENGEIMFVGKDVATALGYN